MILASLLFLLSVLFVGLTIYYYTVQDYTKMYYFSGGAIICSIASMLMPESSYKTTDSRVPLRSQGYADALNFFKSQPPTGGRRRRR